MKVFISCVSGEMQHVASLASVFSMNRRPGDELFEEHTTRGDVARESMLETFLQKKEFDALLMLDADQRHPVDMLDQLRDSMEANNLDMVCAHYYRRGTKQIQSLCYELTSDGTFPFLPLLHPPTSGLHEIAITGLGCVLIHRRVLEAVQATLPKGMTAFSIGTLESESGDYENWGSDFRFFTLARRLGYRLWLNADVESLHAVTLWLGHKAANKLVDYTAWADAAQDLLIERIKLHGMSLEAFRQRKRVLEARRDGLLQKAEPLKGKPERLSELQEISVAIYIMEGRIVECDAWIEMISNNPPIVTPGQLPTTDNMPAQQFDSPEAQAELSENRQEMYRQQAIDLVNELPDLKGHGRR